MSKEYTLRSYADVSDIEAGTSHREVVERVRPGARVLDAGCATGYIAEALSQLGCEVYGIDISPKAVEAARIHCKDAVCADLDTATLPEIFPNKQFDYILFGDVLEHLRDPLRALEGARSMLTEGGRVIASIPNAAHGAVQLALLQGDFDYEEFGILDSTHLRFFTLDSARELFLRAGFTIDAIARTKHPIFVEEGALVPHVVREDFDDRVLDIVESQSESTTLQFIIEASPYPEEERIARLADQVTALRRELNAAQRAQFRSKPSPADQRAEARLRGSLEDAGERLRKLDEMYVHERDRLADVLQQNIDLIARIREAEAIREQLQAQVEAARRVIGQIGDERSRAIAQLNQELVNTNDRANNLEHQCALYEAEIGEIKKSKFWKAKRLWAAVRRQFSGA